VKSAVVLASLLAAGAVALHFTSALPSNLTGIAFVRRVPDIALTADTGATVRLDRMERGALVVLGYTRCTDECPPTLAKVAAAARGLPRGARPNVYFLTVDPDYDTPAELHRYLAVWHGAVIGLSADRTTLNRVSTSLGTGGGLRQPSDHDTRLFLIDRQGELVTDTLSDPSVEELRRILAAEGTR
jgi:protein SCO1/2